MTKTYIFAGHDHSGSFQLRLEEARNNPDCIIIDARPGESFAQAVKRANMPAGSQAYLFCHGGENGTFTWNEGRAGLVSYSQGFAAFPSGTSSIDLMCCYGGTAITANNIQHAPAGCTVISRISSTNAGQGGGAGLQIFKETAGLTDPVDRYLEYLDNFDPEKYKQDAERWSRESGRQYNTNPLEALPTIIGVGGNPPSALNVLNVLNAICHPEKYPSFKTIDEAKMDKALARVHERFESDGMVESGLRMIGQDQISKVADKLRNHEKLKGPEEIKIALALCAAYADELGMLKARVVRAELGSIVAHTLQSNHPHSQSHHKLNDAEIDQRLNRMGLNDHNAGSKKYSPDEKKAMNVIERQIVEKIDGGSMGVDQASRLLESVRFGFRYSAGNNAVYSGTVENLNNAGIQTSAAGIDRQGQLTGQHKPSGNSR